MLSYAVIIFNNDFLVLPLIFWDKETGPQVEEKWLNEMEASN